MLADYSLSSERLNKRRIDTSLKKGAIKATSPWSSILGSVQLPP